MRAYDANPIQRAMNFRQLAYGIGSFTPTPLRWWIPETGGTGSSRYCYAVWLRQITQAELHAVPESVGELGPGDSIGTGLAALISGASRYLALDAVAHAEPTQNLQLFDEILALFQGRADIPGSDEFPGMATFHQRRFPLDALGGDSALSAALSPSRIRRLREGVRNGDRGLIDYRAPWHGLATHCIEPLDFIFSNAVLEHVVDIPMVHAALSDYLLAGGLASHQIDFRSHGLFKTWDGHRAAPDWLWKLLVGRRPYLLNRAPLSVHLKAAQQAGLEMRKLALLECAPASKPSSRFAALDQRDISTAEAYLLLQKPT